MNYCCEQVIYSSREKLRSGKSIFQLRSYRGCIYVLFLWPTDWMAKREKNERQVECAFMESLRGNGSSCGQNETCSTPGRIKVSFCPQEKSNIWGWLRIAEALGAGVGWGAPGRRDPACSFPAMLARRRNAHRPLRFPILIPNFTSGYRAHRTLPYHLTSFSKSNVSSHLNSW